MKSAILEAAWKILVLACLVYIAYLMHIAGGGLTFGQAFRSINPTAKQEEPAPSPSGGISFDSMYPAQSDQIMKFRIEQEKLKDQQKSQ